MNLRRKKSGKGSAFLKDCREKLKTLEQERSKPYLSWKDVEHDTGNMALIALPPVEFGEQQHHQRKEWKFQYFGSTAVKVFGPEDEVVLHWNIEQHGLDVDFIRCPLNQRLREEIGDEPDAAVLMLTGHELIQKGQNGYTGNTFHKVSTVFYGKNSDAYALLMEESPMLGR